MLLRTLFHFILFRQLFFVLQKKYGEHQTNRWCSKIRAVTNREGRRQDKQEQSKHVAQSHCSLLICIMLAYVKHGLILHFTIFWTLYCHFSLKSFKFALFNKQLLPPESKIRLPNYLFLCPVFSYYQIEKFLI